MKMQRRRQLGEILIAHGIITPNELAQALEAQKADAETLRDFRRGVLVLRELSQVLGIFIRPVAAAASAPRKIRLHPRLLIGHRVVGVSMIRLVMAEAHHAGLHLFFDEVIEVPFASGARSFVECD